MSSPDPTRLHPRTRAGLRRLDRLGRRDQRHPLGALAALRRPRGAGRDAAGDGRAGSISSGRSATARSCGRRRNWGERGFTFGDWLQPVGDNRKPEPTIGDDCAATIYLYISCVLDGEGGRRRRRRGACGRRWTTRAAEVKQAFARGVHHAVGPARLQRPDVLCAGLPLGPDPRRARRGGEGLLPGGGRADATAASAPASSAPRRSCRRWSRSARPTSPRRSSCRTTCPAGSTRSSSGATTIWERWDAIRADGTIYDPDDELLQPLCLRRGLPVAVRERRGLPARPGACRASAASSSSRRSCRRSAPVAASHDSAAGRIEAGWTVDGRRGRPTTSPCRRARAACWCFGPATPTPSSTASRSPARGADGKARSLLAPGPHTGDVPDQQGLTG